MDPWQDPIWHFAAADREQSPTESKKENWYYFMIILERNRSTRRKNKRRKRDHKKKKEKETKKRLGRHFSLCAFFSFFLAFVLSFLYLIDFDACVKSRADVAEEARGVLKRDRQLGSRANEDKYLFRRRRKEHQAKATRREGEVSYQRTSFLRNKFPARRPNRTDHIVWILRG